MSQISVSDIKRRLNYLSQSSKDQNVNAFIENAKLAIESNKDNRIISSIENACKSNKDIPISTYCELFDALVESETSTVGQILKCGALLEKAVHKTRNAKQAQTYLRRKLGRIKSKLKSTVNKGLIKAGIMKEKPKKQYTKHEAAYLAYEAMDEAATIAINCDRVLENYDKISKRFNLEILFNENTRRNGYEDTVVELCRRIDTYEMPSMVKFNTVIETALYGFESNAIAYTKAGILENAVDYFMFKEDGLRACRDILEATMFFDKNEDMGNIDIFTEEEPETDDLVDVEEGVRTYCANKNRVVTESNEPDKNDTDFEKIFKKFKREELDKEPHKKLKILVNKLYSRNVTGVIEDTPKLLTWIRSFFILGTGTIPVIGPVIMVISFIADKIISMKMERKEVERMMRCFEREIKVSKDKLKSMPDGEDKDNLKKYIKALEDANVKINDYYDRMLTDEELEKRYDDIYSKSYDSDDDDIDYSKYDDMSEEELEKLLLGDDFDDFFKDEDFLEMGVMAKMGTIIESFVNSDACSRLINGDDYFSIIGSVFDGTLTDIATIAAKYPEEFCKEELTEAIERRIYEARHEPTIVGESSVEKAMRLNGLQAAKSILSFIDPEPKPVTIYEAKHYLDCVVEAYAAVGYLAKATSGTMLEGSIQNTLNMASMKLKNVMNKLSDKDRQISQSIDMSMSNLKKGVENSFTNSNREAVIKGSILPSASKMIKLGIANAGLIAIGQPVLAAVATLGYLGTAGKFKAKERQLLTDEIEIELKMCNKYIDIAEQKNDMKALKQLLMIQRDLERQLQRIKYKMKAELGQKYYDPKSGDNTRIRT